ncbi:MAG TPA: hypothetical protein VFI37_13440 [Gaiellaceae bacterium]|nr:hypothetical protein [Gaiellaceae bacterium]
MRQLIAASACALGLLAGSGGAWAGVHVGVNDDAGKYAGGAPEFWQAMEENGLDQNTMTVLWDETRPDAILDASFIRNALPAAEAAGVQVVFDVYPMHSQALTSDSANIGRFAAFVGEVARAFPSVTQYVVMNECNQPRFVNPQFDDKARNRSAALCGRALAAAYDTLKSIDEGIFVWGIGLSPRGNDRPWARSNASTSPVTFLADLGAWYRSSGRAEPIMDGLDFHPYPVPQSQDFATGYAATKDASVSNLDRIYQAFYDAFDGTGQPTIGPQAGGGLPVSLNEVGIQTATGGRPGYTGYEASAGAGGVNGRFATQAFQADWYVKMLDLVACDPNVQVVDIFHLVDESDLGAWQSGLYYVGYEPKASAAAVAGWIAETGGECAGAESSWRPRRSIGATPAASPALQATLKSARRAIAALKRDEAQARTAHAKTRALTGLLRASTLGATLARRIETATAGVRATVQKQPGRHPPRR